MNHWEEMGELRRRLEALENGKPNQPKIAKPSWATSDVLVVGAGITGLTIARLCAEQGDRVFVVDQRSHIGGNCYDELDELGCVVHRYGPHIFHTASIDVVEFLSRFTEWRPYEHRVLAKARGKLVPMPVNATTLELLFDVKLPTEEKTAEFLKTLQIPCKHPRNSEQVVLSRVGRELYELLFLPYTEKQWGRSPKDLAPGVCGRIPVRTSRDDRYFTDWFQAMPRDGYTAMFERMIDHPRIGVGLEVDGKKAMTAMRNHSRVVWTGPLDAVFDSCHGELPWRSLKFELEHFDTPDWLARKQPVAVINEPNAAMPYTRKTEYRWLTCQSGPLTAIHVEYPSATGEPFYPVPSEDANALAMRYRGMAKQSDVVVCGRLGRYQYLEMGQAVASALKTFRAELAKATNVSSM